MPKPARMEVVPLVPGDQASPMRGMKSRFCTLGSPKLIRPGVLDMALSGWERSL